MFNIPGLRYVYPIQLDKIKVEMRIRERLEIVYDAGEEASQGNEGSGDAGSEDDESLMEEDPDDEA